MVYHGILLYYMVNHAITWQTVVDHAFSYIVYSKCMVYHGFPVSKHHGLPWFPWYIMVFYHGLPVSKHHGILPWFTCFKTTWYLPWNTMVYFHKGMVMKILKEIFFLT